jgi:tetratricopeptide (TPR) repeat protein
VLVGKAHGEKHPRNIHIMLNLGINHEQLALRNSHLPTTRENWEHLMEGVKLIEDALALSREVLGDEHPTTLAVIINLGTLYFEANRIDEALAMREEGMSLSRKIRGAEHPETLAAMQNLAISRSQAGHLDEGIAMMEQVLTIRRRTLGPKHPDTGHAATKLGYLYDQAGAGKNENGGKTIAAWLEAVQIHPSNADMQYHLGKLLMAQDRPAEALAPLEAARRHYPDGERGSEARELLIQALTALGRETEAAEARQELSSLPGAR